MASPVEKPKSELSLRDTLSFSVQLYRKGFLFFFIPALASSIILSSATTLVFQRLADIAKIYSSTLVSSSTESAIAFLLQLLPYFLIYVVLAVVVESIVYVYTFKLADEIVSGRIPDASSSFRFALAKLPKMVVTQIMIGVIVIVGAVLLIVPGVLAAIVLTLALPIISLEEVSPTVSMSKSYNLVKGRWLKTFALFIVYSLIVVVASFVLGFLIPASDYREFISSVLMSVISPFSALAILGHYYSMSVRGSRPQSAVSIEAGTTFVYCFSCGVQISPSNRFCPACGKEQPAYFVVGKET